MAVRRDSLRARSDFFSPMTGNTSGTRFAGERRGSYTEEAKRRLQNLDTGRTESPVIEAIKVAVQKTEDPFTQIAGKKSYAPEEENDFIGALEGAAGAAQDVVNEGVSKVQDVVKSTGRRAAERRAEQQYKRQQEREADKAETDKKFASFGQAYRSDLSSFADKTGAKFSDYEKSLKSLRTDFTGSKADQARAMKEFKAGIRSDVALGDKNLADKLSAYSKELSGKIDYTGQRVTDVEGKIGEQQKQVSSIDQRLGTTYGGVVRLKESLAAIKAKQDARTAPKQVSNLPSNYKATEAEAFRVAKAYQEAKGIAARNPNVSVGVDSKGRPTATANQQTRSEAGARTAQANKARVQNNARARAQAAAVNRKLSGKSISQTKAANQQSMRDNAAARHKAYKAAKAAGKPTARTASAQRARNKAAAKTRAKNAAKARNKRSKKGKKGGGGGCPDPMMLILMANGSQKRAGDLKVGDLIKTNHEKDMKLGEYKVEYVNVLNNREKAKFTFEESEIVCSLTHKFYVDNDWKEAKDMKVGDEVSGQKLISIENVEDGDVVHITVEDAHTYICEGLLSHNKRCDIRTKDDIAKLTDMNLLRDDLANVAYFVKELQETI